jgi:hypothetical protein
VRAGRLCSGLFREEIQVDGIAYELVARIARMQVVGAARGRCKAGGIGRIDGDLREIKGAVEFAAVQDEVILGFANIFALVRFVFCADVRRSAWRR